MAIIGTICPRILGHLNPMTTLCRELQRRGHRVIFYQVPLAAEESVDPKRDMPRGIMLGFGTLVLSAFCVVLLNPSIAGVGSHALGSSLEPALDGIRAIYGDAAAPMIASVASGARSCSDSNQRSSTERASPVRISIARAPSSGPSFLNASPSFAS